MWSFKLRIYPEPAVMTITPSTRPCQCLSLPSPGKIRGWPTFTLIFVVWRVSANGNTRRTLIAERIRQVGIKRILWSSDGAFGAGINPEQALRAYRQLPLSADEFHTIDNDLAPYMR
jgi:hypothetical protein